MGTQRMHGKNDTLSVSSLNWKRETEPLEIQRNLIIQGSNPFNLPLILLRVVQSVFGKLHFQQTRHKEQSQKHANNLEEWIATHQLAKNNESQIHQNSHQKSLLPHHTSPNMPKD